MPARKRINTLFYMRHTGMHGEREKERERVRERATECE
jgi:hypothetical protein